MVSLVVWDMDGTLIDSTTVVPDAFVSTIRDLDGPAVERDDVVHAYSLGVPEVILEHLMGRGLTDSEIELFYRRVESSTVVAYPGVVDALSRLRDRLHPVAVFTGASSRSARALLASAMIEVDVLIGGETVKPKPSGEGLVRAAQSLDCKPADLIYVGDGPNDLLAARDVGALAAAAAWGHLYDSEARADAVLRGPLEVLRLL